MLIHIIAEVITGIVSVPGLETLASTPECSGLRNTSGQSFLMPKHGSCATAYHVRLILNTTP